ncbi:replication protein A 70 kDa DNA-binding subunit E-like [Vicia villosa]|uniref:replication protein A 70 kDa DNA-binding subunit E-like n=1 Tax=Vicia villosa TaxID=3911 RepID=UPI00273A945E|nr:replication protein A 70 kDa DNA-binding subunit E-like [Vicia villosa]
MSRAAILIKDLVKGNQVWKMQIRVVDLWVIKEKTGQQHLECVIQDVKGDQIHVITRSRDFKEWIDQVKENETYSLYNGEPVVNDGPFKVCANPLKLLFNGGTTVTNVAFPEIPLHKYNFQPIENFLKGSIKHDMLYDVIGVLQDVLRTQVGGGGRKSCANITLRDIEGNVIEVVLWGDYCKQFLSYNTPGKMAGPTIIILTHAWCKPNTVSGVPMLSNAWNGSRLHINLEHPQVEEFRASFGENELSNAPDFSLSLTFDSSLQSSNNNWKSLDEVKSIRDIAALGKKEKES